MKMGVREGRAVVEGRGKYGKRMNGEKTRNFG